MAGETVITVVGNLVDDPELRFTPSGAAVANFRIASTPRTFDKQSNEWKDGDALFLSCSVWRQAAENVAESLQKGMRVVVQGRLKQRSYETREGEKRTVVELEVEEVGPSLKYATAKVARVQRSGGRRLRQPGRRRGRPVGHQPRPGPAPGRQPPGSAPGRRSPGWRHWGGQQGGGQPQGGQPQNDPWASQGAPTSPRSDPAQSDQSIPHDQHPSAEPFRRRPGSQRRSTTMAKAVIRKPKKKVCQFCKEKVSYVDYKDTNLLRKFISDRGKIRARRVTGNCVQHQRDVATAVKNAREVALLPYTSTAR